ncbi:hypothetical protein ANCCAN_09936 [Ancylostoma caninum]|uniref:Uncharacterized protein n=1 Tax=Ancylostoma caninum TaxID=29170 RepID=A0A368GI78_ANCCA|nr:hypothetical protein ANCCAN_09936 [Ancylostoma caninum]
MPRHNFFVLPVVERFLMIVVQMRARLISIWKQVIAEIRQEGERIRKKQKAEDSVSRRLGIFRKELRRNRSGYHAVKMQKINVFGDEDDEIKMEKLMERAKKVEDRVDDKEKLMMGPIELLRDAVKIGMALSGRNVSNFNEKNVKMISPRFLSILPDEEEDETVKLISPSLFALHDDGRGIEKETSLAKTFAMLGKNDNEAWLDFIIEAAGVSDALDSMKAGFHPE